MRLPKVLICTLLFFFPLDVRFSFQLYYIKMPLKTVDCVFGEGEQNRDVKS